MPRGRGRGRADRWQRVAGLAVRAPIAVDPIAVPCRECLAPSGRFCFVMTLHGPCEDSINPRCHGVRIEDAKVTSKILSYVPRSVGPAR
jgi:hypothetical protein